MLVPAFGGFNLAQLIMVWATAVGVGIAGVAADASVNAFDGALTKTYTAPVGLLSGEDIQLLMEDKVICLVDWEGQVRRWASDGVEDTDATSLRWGIVSRDVGGKGNRGVQLLFGAVGGSTGGYLEDDCGSVTIRIPDPAESNDEGTKAILTAVSGAIRQALPILANAVLSEYRAIASLEQPSVNESAAAMQRLSVAIMTYNATIRNAGAKAADGANSASAKNNKKGDWVAMGYATASASMKSLTVGKSVSSQPEASEPKRPSPGKGDMKQIMRDAEKMQKEIADNLGDMNDAEIEAKL